MSTNTYKCVWTIIKTYLLCKTKRLPAMNVVVLGSDTNSAHAQFVTGTFPCNIKYLITSIKIWWQIFAWSSNITFLSYAKTNVKLIDSAYIRQCVKQYVKIVISCRGLWIIGVRIIKRYVSSLQLKLTAVTTGVEHFAITI